MRQTHSPGIGEDQRFVKGSKNLSTGVLRVI
jgi:hypothetical protein